MCLTTFPIDDFSGGLFVVECKAIPVYNQRVQSIKEKSLADLTGTRRAFHASYEEIALRIRSRRIRNGIDL